MSWPLSCENFLKFDVYEHSFYIQLAIVPIVQKNPLLYVYA